MNIDQDTANRILIAGGWVLVVVCTLAMGMCLTLWWLDRISDRAMLGLTLALSWAAIVLQGALLLVQGYTKRDIDS